MSDATEIRSELIEMVTSRYFQGAKRSQLRISPWAILDFSSVFNIVDQQRHGVYVKVPKSRIGNDQVHPESQQDRDMAAAEYASLQYLAKYWNGFDPRVEFITPLEFFPAHNAIVTRQAFGHDLLISFRRADLKYKFMGQRDEHVRPILQRIGAALRNYHDASAAAEQPMRRRTREEVVRKFVSICDDLAQFGVERSLLDQVTGSVAGLEIDPSDATHCMTLKGLDIRNILVDEQDRTFLLDPGKTIVRPTMEDVARYLVTCDIIYWGSLWFFLRLRPDSSYNQATMDGYGALGVTDARLLSAMILKEFLKHWRAAHVAVGLKHWPALVKKVIIRTYIDPFYRTAVKRKLRDLNE